jgi:hypothetical protein
MRRGSNTPADGYPPSMGLPSLSGSILHRLKRRHHLIRLRQPKAVGPCTGHAGTAQGRLRYFSDHQIDRVAYAATLSSGDVIAPSIPSPPLVLEGQGFSELLTDACWLTIRWCYISSALECTRRHREHEDLVLSCSKRIRPSVSRRVSSSTRVSTIMRIRSRWKAPRITS